MKSVMAYGGNNLMNMVLARVYSTQRNKFKGVGSSGGLAYTFDVTHVPVAKLVSNRRTHNLEIDLTVAISASGGLIQFDNTVTMKATGLLAISQSQLSLSGLNVTTSSTNLIDQVVAGVVNTQIVPAISSTLAGIPIPQLTKVLGSSLSAKLQTARVIPGPALEAGASLVGKTGIAPADAPTVDTIARLNTGTSTNALMSVVVSAGAVNALIKEVVAPLAHTFDERASKLGFGAGIKGTIRATTPVLNVQNGSGNANTSVSFTGLKGGIRVPLKGWTWVSLSAPKTNVVVTNALSGSGSTGLLTLTGVGSIKVVLNWPTLLKPVEALVKGLLNGILSLFRGTISNAVKGRKFELFKLPATIPGTNLAANLSFASGGLAYFKRSVQAVVRIRV